VSANDTAVVLSEKFLAHRCQDSHPENPARLEPILKLFDKPWLKALPVITPVLAQDRLLESVHSAGMIEALKMARGSSGWFDSDTYFGPQSIETALFAAGSGMELATKIWKGEFRRGFSLVRPPGHHATPNRVMGFCLLNNVALAAAAILNEKPTARLAIVDFDLHHGNGTQDAFYQNPNVLFISSHRFPFYPGTGSLEENGTGAGKGTCVNFPLNRPFGDNVFVALYGDVVYGMLKKFRPDMILVSAGFDGHFADPMQGFQLSSDVYGVLAEWLIAAAELTTGKILFCLEGGYEPEALAESVEVVMDRLVNLPRAAFTPALPRLEGDLSTVESLKDYYVPFFPGI